MEAKQCSGTTVARAFEDWPGEEPPDPPLPVPALAKVTPFAFCADLPGGGMERLFLIAFQLMD